MSTQDTTRSPRIVINALTAKAPGSEMAINVVDEAGALLERACVNEDGSCELSQEALALADGVVVELGSVLVDANMFRELIEKGEPVDVKELLAATCRAASSSSPEEDDHGHTSGKPDYGWGR
jgi:hypothetical protein